MTGVHRGLKLVHVLIGLGVRSVQHCPKSPESSAKERGARAEHSARYRKV